MSDYKATYKAINYTQITKPKGRPEQYRPPYKQLKKMSKYIRTTPKTFEELTARQTVIAREILGEDAEETQWIDDPTDPNACLPLCNFERSSGKIWDGFYGMSYFSGYFIKFSRSQDTATVGYRHW